MARYQVRPSKSQLSDTFQLIINTYITTDFRLTTKNSLDIFSQKKKKKAALAKARKEKTKY